MSPSRTVGWVVAAGSPPAVAIGVWLNFVKSHLAIDFVKSHPVIAIILFGTYEIMLVVVFFAWEIVRKLWERWRDWIVDHIDLWSRRRFHPLRKALSGVHAE